ncbi:MAG: DUF3465 domain-containing protein [Methylococcaceae bacterium]|nr:DUF3465 domain-containing protein [Methylococcaceae bacterium]
MKKILYLIVFAVLVYGLEQNENFALPSTVSPAQNAETAIQTAYNNKQSDIQVQGTGTVIKVLADDLDGSRHQRFILKFNRLSLLIAHNIDLAPKINGLRAGDSVTFYGEYEWNAKGGIVHWTHHDPAGRHIDGWLKHNGKTYQ